MPASKRLLVSIHDVGPRFEDEIDRLVDRLSEALGGLKFAMLVVPDHWDEAPLQNSPAYQRKLRGWSDAGVEMFLHGWCHRDDSRSLSGLAAMRARHMTGGEGEFLALSRTEARRRMQAGRAVVENAIGVQVAGFIAPAWLYSQGAHEALADERFALAEDHFRVWRPDDGKVVSCGPVITWASRSKARIASSRTFASIARTALQPLATVRIAVHPGDVRVPALLHSIDATLASFTRNRLPGRYRDLLT